MSLRFVCIEVRKNLRCANVFLQFDQSLTETEFLKINVEEYDLRLLEYSTETRASVSGHFSIEARTMSTLTVEECNASFRLTIDNIREETDANIRHQEAAKTTWECKPQLEEGSEEASIHCRNCECNLTGTAQQFKRIREFPSGSIDMGEFFCHNHGTDFGKALLPKVSDLFFGFQFIVLNNTQLQNTTKVKEQHLYCKRCLQYLGETLFDGKAAKLWSDTLVLRLNCHAPYIDIFHTACDTPNALLLHKIIRESSVAVEPTMLLQQMHFSKVLLEATFPNRQRKYLLLHLLEKHLRVLRNTKPLAHGSHNNNNVLQVELEPFKCFKLLYRLMSETEKKKTGEERQSGKSCSEGESVPPLFVSWQQDISIHLLRVSPTMFSLLLEELDDNSLLLPELYRYTSDGFQLSYVFYKN